MTMRLIDADALMCNVKRAVYTDDLSTTIAVGICESHIKDMPTIDAIPVEWLQRKRKEALQEGMRPDEVEAVEMVLWMWQKEQEAR